jgi:hypothetical protein
MSNNTKAGRYTEDKKAVDNADPSDYNEMKRSHKNLDEIKKLDMTENFTSLYNKYGKYLDKIVCLI